MPNITSWLRIFGFDIRKCIQAILGYNIYIKHRREFRNSLGNDFKWGKEFPIIGDWSESSGNAGAYFFQDILVARWVYEASPIRHIDVGSRLDGFIAHLAVFREVEVLDIRQQSANINNIKFWQIDLTCELQPQWINATDSLSCLHTIEHFGLGRYGDRIDINGYKKGFNQLKSLLKPGGILYISTPLGSQRVEFNAHRVFSAVTILSWFDENWIIEKFAVIDDNNNLIINPDRSKQNIANNFGCNTGVAIIVARRLQ